MSSHEVLNTIAIVASVISSAAALSYWLASKFEKLESKLSRLEDTVSRLENAFLLYNELLLKILEAKASSRPWRATRQYRP
ncbi:MAG: hypothetical protein QXU72_08655 [Thermofilum sp.]